MGLLKPVSGATITQNFDGHLSGGAFYHQNLRGLPLAAYKYKFPGYDGYNNPYHGAVDWAAPLGTPIVAQERSKVIQFGTDSYSGYAKYVFLEISPKTSTRERVRIEHWHLNGFRAGLYVGQIVPRGYVIGYVGKTGWATGYHDHNVLKILEYEGGAWRDYLYNISRFLTGGDLAADPRIKPYY